MVLAYVQLLNAQYQYKKSFGYQLDDTGSVSIIFDNNSTESISKAQLLPFEFKFYDHTYNRYFIAKNGFICFDVSKPTSTISNNYIPNKDSINNAIYALWTDVGIDAPDAKIYSYTTTKGQFKKHFIVWKNVTVGESLMTFAIVLFEENNQIDLVYNRSDKQQIVFATVGIENRDGTQGIMVHDKVAEVLPKNNLSNFDTSLFSTIGRVRGPKGFGSGIMITPTVGITANHVINKLVRGASKSFHFNYGHGGHRKRVKIVEAHHLNENGGDLAIFRLQSPIDSSYRPQRVFGRALTRNDGRFHITTSGTSGGYHYARILAYVKKKGRIRRIKRLDNVSMRAGDSGGTWALELANFKKPVSCGIVHGGGRSTQTGLLRRTIDSMINVYTGGKEYANWIDPPIIYNVKIPVIDECFNKKMVYSFYQNELISQSKGFLPDFLGPDTTFCSNDSLELVLTAPENMLSYRWNGGSTGRTLRIKSRGTYWVEILDSNDCKYVDTLQVRQIDAPPKPTISISGDTIKTDYSNINVWYRDGFEIPDEKGPFIIINEPGKYSLEVFNSDLCSTLSNTLSVVVLQNNVKYLDDVRIYPLPFDDYLYIGPLNTNISKINIGNLSEVFFTISEENLQANTISFNTKHLPQGLYYVQIFFKNGDYLIKKILK